MDLSPSPPPDYGLAFSLLYLPPSTPSTALGLFLVGVSPYCICAALLTSINPFLLKDFCTVRLLSVPSGIQPLISLFFPHFYLFCFQHLFCPADFLVALASPSTYPLFRRPSCLLLRMIFYGVWRGDISWFNGHMCLIVLLYGP